MGKSAQQKPTPPGKGLMFTPAEMIAALRLNHGNASATARSLKCDRTTVLEYCDRFPEVKAAREEGVEIRLDSAEEALSACIAQHEPWAVQMALRGQGAKRGHAERSVTDLTTDGQPLRFGFALDNAGKDSEDA